MWILSSLWFKVDLKLKEVRRVAAAPLTWTQSWNLGWAR
jgi:hypothetical protein